MKMMTAFLMAALIVFTAFPAFADDGIAIEVVNKLGKDLNVKLVVDSWGSSKTIERTAPKDGTVRFDKSETKHPSGAMIPNWKLTFHGDCNYQILSNDDGTCTVQTGISSCAYVENLGICNVRFTVAE